MCQCTLHLFSMWSVDLEFLGKLRLNVMHKLLDNAGVESPLEHFWEKTDLL